MTASMVTSHHRAQGKQMDRAEAIRKVFEPDAGYDFEHAFEKLREIAGRNEDISGAVGGSGNGR